MRMFRASAASLAAFLLAAPALAVTANAGLVQTFAQVDTPGQLDEDDSVDVQIGLPGTLNALSVAQVDTGRTVLTSLSAVNATWASARAGEVALAWGWNTSGEPLTGVAIFETIAPDDQNWVYSFTTGARAATFSADWALDVTLGEGDAFSGRVFGGGGLPFHITPDTDDPADGVGSFSIALAPNTSYSLRIFNFGNYIGVSDQKPQFGAVFTMDWQISVVPEPASWALMIAGFGLVGGAIRRQRKVQTAAC